MGIGLGSSPIGNEGFAHPSARSRRSKTKLVLQIILSVTRVYIYIYTYIHTYTCTKEYIDWMKQWKHGAHSNTQKNIPTPFLLGVQHYVGT